ncbi:beta-glucosidase [Cellulomonas hominis]
MQHPHDDVLQPLVDQLTLDEKVSLLTGRDSWSLRAIPRIGLRSIVMSDGPAGVRGPRWDERDPSVSFPSPTAVAASWDRQHVRAVGRGLGSEARRKGVDVVLAPTINLQRTPYGGRHFEAFSEDPLLTSELATEYVRGIQDRGVGATVKHYVANDSETDRFTVDVRVDERTLRELYLAAFEGPVVDGGAWLVMSAYNSVNGATASESPLLTSPLQDEWGFDGVVVSDWTAVRSIESARHPQDLAMPGPDGAWGERLAAAVRTGDVEEKAIDRKVLRILRLAARVGALEGFGADSDTRPDAGEDDLRALVRATALAGTTLLANDGILPLASPTSIVMIGEGARVARIQGGGSATVIPDSAVSPFEGVRRRWPDARVDFSLGAVVQRGLAPLAPGTFLTPDGEPGMRVRYLAADGSELGSETRSVTSLVWFDGGSAATRSATVEFAFRYLPGARTTRAPLAVAGLADVDLVADGVPVETIALRSASGDDPASVVLNPPWAATTVPVTGEAVDLLVRFRPIPGGMPDSLSLRVGTPPVEADPDELIERAALAAAAAEVAVVVVSTSNEVESEGFDRDSLELPGHQDALVRAVAAANPRTVVVVNSGAPVLLPWRADVAGVLVSWFPGQEFGHALAEVLSGDSEPGGRLPVTWPGLERDVPVRQVTPVDGRLEYREGIHVGDRAWRRAGATPAYPFGHGLGYTTWEVSDLETTTLRRRGEAVAAVTVSNRGARTGKCVVQLYAERPDSRVDRPARWLVGFEAVVVPGGASVRARVNVPWRRFAHWEDGAWRLERGGFTVVAGISSSDDQSVAQLSAE